MQSQTAKLNNPFNEELRLAQALAAYLPSSLYKEVIQTGPSYIPAENWQAKKGSFLFADVNGFTAMWNRLGQSRNDGSEELTYLINHYFENMLGVIQRFGGIPLKFGGDSLLAVFNGPYYPVWAVACAAEMQRVADSYRIVHTSQGSFNLNMSIGLHSGLIRSAVLGQPSGRMEFLVSGPSLQQTLAAETLASKGEVLTTQALYQQLEHNQLFKFDIVKRDEQDFYRLQDASWIPARYPHSYKPSPTKIKAVLELLGHFVPDLVRESIENKLAQHQLSGLESEHRQVTCFFLGVMNPRNSRAHKQHLQQLNQLFLLVTRLAAQHGGSVARLDANAQGERLLLLFGAPITNEDDATRALVCAIRFFEEKALLNNGLECRIGIASGPVFSTEVGTYWRKEYTIMGSSINLAARLTAKAPPGQIWLDEATQQTVAGQLLQKVEPVTMRFKGFDEPVRVYTLKGQVSLLASKVGSGEPTNLPLVGRIEAMQYFYQRLESLKRSNIGAIVAIHAPAGYGKTRLINQFTQNWRNYAWGAPAKGQILSVECTGYHSLVPYYPWLTLLDQLSAQIEQNSEPNLSRFQRLSKLLEKLAPNSYAEDIWTFKYLLDQSNVGHSETDRGDIFKRSFLRLWDELWKGATALGGPLLIIIDNFHYCDQLSLELFNSLSWQVQTLPLVLCAVGRTSVNEILGEAETEKTKFNQPVDNQQNFGWLKTLVGAGWPLFEQIELGPLKPAEVRLQVAQLLGVEHISSQLLKLIMRQTEGNPFYVEELISMLRQAKQLTINPRTKRCQWREVATTQKILATASLKNLIMSRLDALAPLERELLQMAAVVERDFEPILFSRLSLVALDPQTVYQTAEQLCVKGWLVTTNNQHYDFKQQLVQQVIYEGLAFSRRRQLHRKIAQFIEENAPERNLEKLAFHYGRSDVGQAAFNYLSKAGHKAFTSYAYRAALTYYEMALDWLNRLQLQYQPPTLLQIYRECGFSARIDGQNKQAAIYFEQMLALARQQNDGRAEVVALNGAATVHRAVGAYDTALTFVEQALLLVNRQEQPELKAETYNHLGSILFFKQDFKLALTHFQYAANFTQSWMKELEPHSKQLEVAQQLFSQCLGNIGLVCVFSAQFGLAHRHFKHAFEIVSSLNLKYVMLTLAINLGELNQLFFSTENAYRYHQQALSLSREIGARDLECEALRNLGMDYLLDGKYRAAEESLWESLDLADLYGTAQVRAQIIENLTEVTLSAGKLEQAADLLEQLQTEGWRTGLLRLQSRLLKLRKHPGPATQILVKAVSEIEKQPSQPHLLWQLHCELAQLYTIRREWLAYTHAIHRAYDLHKEVEMALDGEELAYSFRNAPIVQRLAEEYRFVCSQEAQPHAVTSA